MPAKILLAEDNSDVREMIGLVLTDQGFEVVCVEDGQAALDAVKTGRPDLIITDIQMPKIDGIEMIREVRRQPEMTDVPILVMTANNSGIIDEALHAGANAGTRKPVELGALIGLINSLLSPSVLIFLYYFYYLNIAIEFAADYLPRPV